jgi:GTPase SAR1 family protein
MEAEAKYPIYLTGNKMDQKAWAKRIWERHERGDKTLLPVQVAFAKEALDK